MIKGMTGFGSAQLTFGEVKAILEIKTLNHRYFDISYYLPIGFSLVEAKMLPIIKSEIERGKITVSLKIVEKPQPAVSLNKAVVKKYLAHANALRRELKLKNDLTLSHVIALPGVTETKEGAIDPKNMWPAIEKALRKVMTDLMVMRSREGRSLSADVRDKLGRMKTQLKTIRVRAKVILVSEKKKMTDEEFKSFQKGADVNEELSRMAHYIDEVAGLLKAGPGAGKKMDFIAQEMQRETNTIGSKLQTKAVSNAVIALKSKIEKIREQSQNIE